MNKLKYDKGISRPRLLRLAAMALGLLILAASACSCTFLFPTDDLPDEIFDPPYLENYYVNKHVPIARSGEMEVYKYESASSSTFTLGGRDYHGGIVFGNTAGALGYADIEFPLNGLYGNISFVLSGNGTEKDAQAVIDGKAIYPANSYALEGAYPTLRGSASEQQIGLQIIVDGVLREELILSSYDVARRYTYAVAGAETIEVKVIAGDSFDIYMMEITVWEGEAQPTGYVGTPAGEEPIKLVRDLKPYMIPIGSPVAYYPNYALDVEAKVLMDGMEFEHAIVAQVSTALIGSEKSSIYFDLEGKYGYLTFTAGAVASEDWTEAGAAWLSVYADGILLLEEVISSSELYRRFTLEVAGCRQLRLEFTSKEGNDALGTGSRYGIGDIYASVSRDALDKIEYASGEFFNRPVKVISELGVLGVVSMATDAVYDGKDEGRVFTMGGEEYGEGVVLYAQNNMLAAKPASVAFNLNGNYDAISFVLGQLSVRGVYENDEVEIYADGKLIETLSVSCMSVPREYTVKVTGCRHLEFVSGKLTNSLTERPVIAIANLAAYPSDSTDDSPFPDRSSSDYKKSCDLIDVFGFFEVYNSELADLDGAVSINGGYYDGTSERNGFTVGGRVLNKGLLLKTNVHSALDLNDIYAGSVLGTAMSDWGLSLLSFAGPREVHESAAAIANIRNSGYTSVTFTVGVQASYVDDPSVQPKSRLLIGADGARAAEITLSEDMKPTTYTVELGESCERLLFWLDCPIGESGSHVYAIYDIVLNK